MQTGEYHGFVGQFSIWLRAQVMTWRGPVLLSLFLHSLFFWPKSLQERGFAVAVGAGHSGVQARLRPSLPTLPEVKPETDMGVRHAAVTQAPSGSERSSAIPQHDEERSAESSGPPIPTAVLDAGAVRAYRVAWARALMGSALRENLSADMQGALEVGVVLAASGQVREILLLKSSGVAALDGAVITAMRHVIQSVPLPPALQGRELVMAIPVEVGAAMPISGAGR